MKHNKTAINRHWGAGSFDPKQPIFRSPSNECYRSGLCRRSGLENSIADCLERLLGLDLLPGCYGVLCCRKRITHLNLVSNTTHISINKFQYILWSEDRHFLCFGFLNRADGRLDGEIFIRSAATSPGQVSWSVSQATQMERQRPDETPWAVQKDEKLKLLKRVKSNQCRF